MGGGSGGDGADILEQVAWVGLSCPPQAPPNTNTTASGGPGAARVWGARRGRPPWPVWGGVPVGQAVGLLIVAGLQRPVLSAAVWAAGVFIV